jgi:hypothetical protein
MTTCRNYIVDGNFDSWINSTLSVAAGVDSNGAATMYHFYSGTGGAATITQNAFTGNEPVAMTSPVRSYAKHNQTTASTGTAGTSSCGFWQYVEDAHTLGGRSATFSCWLWLDAGGPITIPKIIARQNFGTGGSPTAGLTFDVAVNWVITTTPQRFSVRIDIPSVAGKVFGTNGNSALQVGPWLPPNAVFAINTTQWQLEQSSPQAPAAGSPTPFEYRGQQAELARVQRYYYQSQGYEAGAWTTANTARIYFQLPVSLRAAPTLTLLQTSFPIEYTGQVVYTMSAASIITSASNLLRPFADLKGTISGGTPATGNPAQLNAANIMAIDARL